MTGGFLFVIFNSEILTKSCSDDGIGRRDGLIDKLSALMETLEVESP